MRILHFIILHSAKHVCQEELEILQAWLSQNASFASVPSVLNASARQEGVVERSRISRGVTRGARHVGAARESARAWRDDGWKLPVVAQGACNRVSGAEM